MSDLVLSAPGVFTAFYNLIAAAAKSAGSQAFAFALNQSEPASYVLVSGIENERITYATTGFGMTEAYDIVGTATVFSGSATPDQPTITTDILAQTFALYQSAVMTPFVSNRLSSPLFNTTGPSPQILLPKRADYSAGPGMVGSGQGGWAGVIDWSFHFECRIDPA